MHPDHELADLLTDSNTNKVAEGMGLAVNKYFFNNPTRIVELFEGAALLSRVDSKIFIEVFVREYRNEAEKLHELLTREGADEAELEELTMELKRNKR